MPHIHEKIDLTAEVFIVFHNKVLLRKHDKYNIWSSVGGHVELDEDPNQAAIREVKEEVGLDVALVDTRTFHGEEKDFKELVPPAFLNRHRINAQHEHVTLTYFGLAETDKFTNSGAEMAKDIRWCSLEDLSDPKLALSDHVRFYAESALKAVKNI